MAGYSSLVSGPCSEAEMRCVGGDGRRKSSSGCGGGAIFRAFFAAGAVAVLFVAPQTAFAQDPSGVSAGFEHSCVVTSTGSVKLVIALLALDRVHLLWATFLLLFCDSAGPRSDMI
eukprot:jgi/Undpi1/8500/HiC_scaffold_25.g10967.m1